MLHDLGNIGRNIIICGGLGIARFFISKMVWMASKVAARNSILDMSRGGHDSIFYRNNRSDNNRSENSNCNSHNYCCEDCCDVNVLGWGMHKSKHYDNRIGGGICLG